MKTISIIFVMALFPWVSQGQFNTLEEELRYVANPYNYNTLDSSQLYINGIVWTHFTPSDFETTIGVAKKSNYYGSKNHIAYENRNYFIFHIFPFFPHKGELIEFEVSSPDVLITLDTTDIRVGDSIEKLKKPFPKSYKGRGDHGGAPRDGEKGITINIEWSDIIDYRTIYINYHPNTRKIIAIRCISLL